MNEKEPVIEIKNLSFSYGATLALMNINFTAYENELICIVGPNGGGKTTFLKLVMGLLKPDKGSIKVFNSRPSQVSSRIGYMPQNPQHDLSFPINVLEVVLMGRIERRLFGPYRSEDKEAAIDALTEVEMQDFSERPFSELSGGQRQRVLIARALGTSPDMLILDEPTANIDPEQEHQLNKILEKLKERMTIIMVTHDYVSEIVQEVVCINRGLEIHPTSRLDSHGFEHVYNASGRIVRHDRKLNKHDD